MIAQRSMQAVLSVLVLSPFVAATEPAPAPRPICKRFDLTCLPYVDPRGLLGVRPAEIVRDMPELGLQTSIFLDLMANHLPNTNRIQSDDLPALAEIDEIVAGFNFKITSQTEDKRGPDGNRGATELGWKTPLVVRTIRPFAWDRLIGKWFPKAVSTRYAGRSYLRIVIGHLPDDLPMCAFCPDERTIVVSGEVSTRALIDRLAAGGPPPTPPPGWGEVDRNPVAVTLDNRTHKFFIGGVVKDHPGCEAFQALADSIEFFSLGISAGTRTTFKWKVTCPDARRAEVVSRNLRRLFEWPVGVLEKGTTGAEIASDLLNNLDLGRDGRSVTGSTSVGRNLFRVFAMLIHGPD